MWNPTTTSAPTHEQRLPGRYRTIDSLFRNAILGHQYTMLRQYATLVEKASGSYDTNKHRRDRYRFAFWNAQWIDASSRGDLHIWAPQATNNDVYATGETWFEKSNTKCQMGKPRPGDLLGRSRQIYPRTFRSGRTTSEPCTRHCPSPASRVWNDSSVIDGL